MIGVGGMCLAPGTGSPGGECTSGPASQPTPGPGSSAGNPIDVTSGNKYQQEIDLPALPGVLGLELKRHYNSRSRYQGLTGYGWRLSYEAVLHADARSIQIIQADGRRIIFPRDPANPNQCASANPQDGRIEIKDNTYEWHWPSGRVLVFGKWNARAARLETIKERSGEFVSLAYGPKGELLSITDPQQRKLSVHYVANARAQIVERISTPAGEFRYRYDAALNLIEARAPDGATRRYHYEAAHNGGDPNNLTGLTDERAVRLATWRYDGEDRAIGAEHAGGADKVSLAYAPHRTVLTNSLGAKSEYRHAEIAGALRLTEARGPGCRSCPTPDRRYTYTAAGQLASLTRLAAEGTPTHTTRTSYDTQGRLSEASEQAHAPGAKARLIARYAYGADNPHPVRIERPSIIAGKLTLTEIAYNGAWQPLTLTERGYDPQGAAIERTLTYSYDRNNRLIALDGPLPGPADVTRLDYDEHGRLIAVHAPENLVTRVRAFDALGRPTKIEDADGQTSEATYTVRGQLATLTRAGLTTRIDYDAAARPAKLTRADGSLLAAHYDEAGRLVALSDAEGNRREASRDSEGNVLQLALRDAAGKAPFDPLSYAYDAYGRLSADSQGTRYAYDRQGRLESLTDSLERRTGFDYDPWGRLTRLLQQAEAPSSSTGLVKTSLARPALIDIVTRLNYAEHDDIARELIAANGARTQRTLDDFGRVVNTVSADAGTASARYDAATRPLELVDADGKRTRFAFDAAGRLTQRLSLGSHENGTRSLDAAIFRYRGTRLVAVANTEQAEGYAYDAQGRLAAQVTLLSRAGQAPLSFTHRYRYDRLGRLIEKRLPDGLALKLAYDSHSRPQQVLLAHPDGRTQPILQDIASDGLRGLTRLVFGNGIATAFARDRKARLAGIATVIPPLPLPSPPTPLPEGEESVVGPAARYSNGEGPGERAHTSSRAEGSGERAHTSSGAQGPGERALYRQGIGYDAAARIVRIVRDESIETYGYDTLDRLAQARSRAEQQGWRYDSTGNRVASFRLDDEASAQPTALGGSAAPTERYQYLPASNRLTGLLRPGVQPAASPAPWRYDASGNPIEIAERRYTYDASGRMAAVFEGERPLARYRYNAHGERIAKLVHASGAPPARQAAANALIRAAHAASADQTTYFLYAGNKIVAEADGAGRIRAHYLYLGHTPIAKIETQPIQPNAPPSSSADEGRDAPPSPPGRRAGDEGTSGGAASNAEEIDGTQPSVWQRISGWLSQPSSSKAAAAQAVRIVFLHCDHLGTPQLATDGEQRIVWRATYTAFGLATPIEDPDGDGASTQVNLRFPGQYFDAETGTHYNYFRDYDPRIGRYLQSDPIGVAGGVNTYGYAGLDPLRASDRLGLWSSRSIMVRMPAPGLPPNLWPLKILAEPVHQIAVSEALTLAGVSAWDIGILQAAVQEADDALYQTGEYAYRHAMTNANLHESGRQLQTKAQAKAQANCFVRSKILYARKLEAQGFHDDALHELGFALHTLQDSTSPSHWGFQDWDDEHASWWKHPLDVSAHVAKELFVPKMRQASQLYQATRDTWYYFGGFEGTAPLPEDFFKYAAD